MDAVADIRKKYQAVKTKELDLTDKYILIRPNHETGASLLVYYRAKDSKNFTYLESIKTPAEKAVLEEFGAEQISTSTYFL